MTPEQRDSLVKVLAVDFDGVIKKQVAWRGRETIIGGPVELSEMIWELSKMREAGWKIIIWSSRSSVEIIKDWLNSYHCDHLFDAINHNPWAPANLQSARKVPANVYIDDRGIRFNGTWSGMADTVINSKSWWEK